MEERIINDRKYFIHNWEEKCPLDWTAVRMMEQNDIDGLLPFKFARMENEKYFRYEAKGGETLKEWLARVQYKECVIKLLVNLVFTGEELAAYLLEQNHICIDAAFITVEDNKCRAAYIPEGEGAWENAQGNILQLAKSIIMSVKYALDEDFSYLFDLQNAFERNDIRNLPDLKKWLRIVNGEEEAGERERDISSISPQWEQNEEKSAPMAAGKIDEKENAGSLEGIFGGLGGGNKKEGKSAKKDEGKQGLFSKKIKKDKKGEEKKPGMEERAEKTMPAAKTDLEKEIINDINRGSATVMTGGAVSVLIRENSAMEYCLTESSYTVGKDAQCDIAVQNNPTVSRKHARIFWHDDAYFIEDLGSTNGTYVNGEKLRKMEPYKLDGWAKIQFSDEKFIFEVR